MDLNRCLVGINTAIYAAGGEGSIGIGFAIPVNMATSVMNDLIETGKVIRGFLGVRMQSVDNEQAEALGMERPYGAIVSEVVAGSPAEKAGMRVGDVIVEVDGKTVENPGDLQSKISQLNPGETHKITVIREGDEKNLTVEIGEMPEDMDQLSSAQQETIRKFGMSLQNVTPDLAERYDLQVDSGVLVTEIERGSQAAEKGIQPGDIITHVGSKPVDDMKEYRKAIEEYEPGESFLLRLRRGENNLFVGLRVPEQE